MKNLILLTLLLLNLAVFGQAPAAINYQAVARTTDGAPLIEEELLVRIGIEATSIGGNLMWEEEHVVTTDGFGLFTLNIGEGASTGNGLSPTFALINWGATIYFLKVEVDGGNGYETLGTSQLVSVPYALYAEEAGNVEDALITDFSFENDSLLITEGGEDWWLDIGPILDEALAGESINLVQLVETDLNIVEGDDAFVVDMSSLQDDEDWSQSETAVYQNDRPVGIGTATPSSDFEVQGSIGMAVVQFQGPVNATLDDTHNIILANVTNGDLTFTLPDASTCTGRIYTFKRFGNPPLSSIVTIVPVNGAEIDTETEWLMDGFDGQVVKLISDGSNWWVLSNETIN
ncbi:MAG: hypothetical protein MK081_07015 [Flavobacteriales bacterium]|nr:hypothetical protein [Flavobacteriales bacterium]